MVHGAVHRRSQIMEIRILPLPDEKRKPKFTDEAKLGFGRLFTDRMLLAEWKVDKGWCDARIEPSSCSIHAGS